MNADLERAWRQWLEADLEGTPDEPDADAALRTLFGVVAARAPRPDFADRVMNAVAVAERDRARRAKVGAAAAMAASVAFIVVGVVLLVGYGPRLLVRGIDLSVQAMLWLLSATQRGLDVWTLVTQIGRALAAVVVAPQVTTVMVAMALIAITA